MHPAICKLRYGATDYPPNWFRDKASGKWTGFLVEMVEDIAKEMGAEAVPVETTWASCVLDFQSNKTDLQFGLGRLALLIDPDTQIWLRKLMAAAELVTITERIVACRDATDDKFIELAVNGHADLIVSGDGDLLPSIPSARSQSCAGRLSGRWSFDQIPDR